MGFFGNGEIGVSHLPSGPGILFSFWSPSNLYVSLGVYCICTMYIYKHSLAPAAAAPAPGPLKPGQ